jgi:hypothetical protein
MSKKANDGLPKQDRSTMEAPTPPPLSEKLIAKLQYAVSAAQRQRTAELNDVCERESTEKQS